MYKRWHLVSCWYSTIRHSGREFSLYGMPQQMMIGESPFPLCCFRRSMMVGKPRAYPGGLLVTRAFGNFYSKVNHARQSRYPGVANPPSIVAVLPNDRIQGSRGFGRAIGVVRLNVRGDSLGTTSRDAMDGSAAMFAATQTPYYSHTPGSMKPFRG